MLITSLVQSSAGCATFLMYIAIKKTNLQFPRGGVFFLNISVDVDVRKVPKSNIEKYDYEQIQL